MSYLAVTSNDTLTHQALPGSPETLCGKLVTDVVKPESHQNSDATGNVLICDICSTLSGGASFIKENSTQVDAGRECVNCEKGTDSAGLPCLYCNGSGWNSEGDDDSDYVDLAGFDVNRDETLRGTRVAQFVEPWASHIDDLDALQYDLNQRTAESSHDSTEASHSDSCPECSTSCTECGATFGWCVHTNPVVKREKTAVENKSCTKCGSQYSADGKSCATCGATDRLSTEDVSPLPMTAAKRWKTVAQPGPFIRVEQGGQHDSIRVTLNHRDGSGTFKPINKYQGFNSVDEAVAHIHEKYPSFVEEEGTTARRTANRVQQHIETIKDAIAGNGPKGELSAEELDALDKNLNITPQEHFTFQNHQAEAHANGTLTTEEAQTVYQALGEVHNPSNGGWAKGTDLATKTSVTTLMGQLLSQSIKRRSSAKNAANQTPDDPTDPRWDDCEIVPDNGGPRGDGRDTNGDQWNRCITHDQLVYGDAPYCEGHREPGYKESSKTAKKCTDCKGERTVTKEVLPGPDSQDTRKMLYTAVCDKCGGTGEDNPNFAPQTDIVSTSKTATNWLRDGTPIENGFEVIITAQEAARIPFLDLKRVSVSEKRECPDCKESHWLQSIASCDSCDQMKCNSCMETIPLNSFFGMCKKCSNSDYTDSYEEVPMSEQTRFLSYYLQQEDDDPDWLFFPDEG